MKKVPFLAASAFALSAAGAAHAADPITLGLGGYWEEWLGVVEQDLDEGTSIDLQPDREIYVMGSTTLDNGITFGANVQFEAQRASDNVDEAYLTISGGFGSFIIGNENSAPYLLHVGAPDVGVAIEEGDVVVGSWVEDDAAGGNVAPITTAILAGDDRDKINYTLPTFSGLTVGATFIPNVEDPVEGNADLTDGQQAYGIGAQYANEFNGAAVTASLGYIFEESDEVNYFSAGIQVGLAGFTVGAGYYTDNGDDAPDEMAWDIGASYGQGPWSVSAVYFKSDSEAGVAEDERRVIQGSFSYTLGPGVAIKGTLARATFEDDGVENEGWAGIVGTRLDF